MHRDKKEHTRATVGMRVAPDVSEPPRLSL